MPDGSRQTLLLVTSPPCAWLGAGRKALIADGETYEEPLDVEPNGKQSTGAWTALRVGLADKACEFLLDGDLAKGCRIRRAADPRQWLEVSERIMEAETTMCLWGCVEHPEWCMSYSLDPEGTLSPTDNPNDCVLGVTPSSEVVLVPRGDKNRRLVFAGGKEMAGDLKEVRAAAARRKEQQKAHEAAVLKRLTPAFRSAFQADGYAQLDGLVPAEIIRTALAAINHQLGGSRNVDALKAKTHSSSPAILDLVRESAIPLVLSQLLGGSPEHYRSRVGGGQIALRFPGDNCPDDVPNGKGEVPQWHFEGVRKAWHIDGLANDFLPGVTDHFGEIHNFDVLVGVLLSDVPKPMAGELCVYPGSHTALAAHFKSQPARLEKLRQKGHSYLPFSETDRLFPRPVVHCTGKAGDVFLCNYLVAHLIAPNASADIRYAIYIRLSGPRFDQRKPPNGGLVESMLDPWVTWEGVGEDNRWALPARPPHHLRRQPTHAELERAKSLASVDYQHLQRAKNEGVWQVKLGHDFRPYDDDVQQALEAAFNNTTPFVPTAIAVRGQRYNVSRSASGGFEQTLATDPTKVREVRRVARRG